MYQASNGLTEHAQPEAQPQGQWRVLNGARRGAPRRMVPRSWWLTMGGLMVATLVLYVHTVNQEFRLTHMKDDLRHMNEELTELRSEKARLQNPSNIDDVARKTLAMQPPQDVVFMTPPKVAKQGAPNRIPLPPAVIHEGF